MKLNMNPTHDIEETRSFPRVLVVEGGRIVEDGAPDTLAADPTGKVSRLFGVYDCGTGLALRGTFIINPEGKLVSSEVNFYNVGRDASELVRKMEANVHLMSHPAEACPAKWTPGAKTL